ncbi:MAG: uncharacterized protein JWP44_4127 [Mucilaginibacter sp.]|nr:uncharacterized protein [Mucilaginibacter sp.]
MVNLVSADVSVTVNDQSFYVPGAASTVPLIIIATADHKLLPDGVTPALGTYEYGVIRTVTSIGQSVQLYGNPNYLVDANGSPQHGDVRNEYGLDALNKVLTIANSAYVLRANVNLNDTQSNILQLWNTNISESGDSLSALVSQYIQEYNSANGLVPADTNYKQTVTKNELTTLMGDALAPSLALYSFSSSDFSNDFIQDHTTDYAGFQDVIYSSKAGFIQTTDATGLQNDATAYGFQVHVVSINGSSTSQIQVQGQNCQHFGTLIAQLQTQIQAATSSNTTVSLIQGRIRITSDLLGATSLVNITSDGFSAVNPLFANTNLFSTFDTPVQGQGIQSLNIYNTAFTIITGSYDGLNAMINNWTSGSIVTNQFTAQEAEGLLLIAGSDFSHTKEFMTDSSLGANDAARRVEVVKRLKAVINDPSTGILADNLAYNLIVCPGFPEVSTDLVTVSTELFEEVFVIGETPFAMPPTGPGSIAEWASTPARVTSYNIAYYYPHFLTTNLDGSTILTTAAAMALRVYAFNDQQADVWYAPAGVKRGSITEASNIGYVTGTLGTATTFVVDFINKGVRDTLVKDGTQINPISFIQGRGILVMGAKTTFAASSQLNRVNASRLVKYIKRALRQGLFVYLFDPNDTITWGNIQSDCNSFLGGLIKRRALFDYATDVSADNNTANTTEMHEVFVDLALKIIPDLEFVFVSLNVVDLAANIGGRSALK